MTTKINQFLKSKIKNAYDNGLCAVRNVLAPIVYDDETILKTKRKVEKAIIFPLIGAGAAAGIAFGAKNFPIEEAKRISMIFVNNSPESFFQAVSTFTGMGLGLGAGAKAYKFAEKRVDGVNEESIPSFPKKEQEMSKFSIKYAVQKIDDYLMKNNPELFELSEKTVEKSALKIKNADTVRQEKKDARWDKIYERSCERAAEKREKEISKIAKMREKQNKGR